MENRLVLYVLQTGNKIQKINKRKIKVFLKELLKEIFFIKKKTIRMQLI